MDDYVPQDRHFATKAIHDGFDPSRNEYGCCVAPINMSTTYKQSDPSEHKGFAYSRSGNPTRNYLEQCLASLEQAQYGLCFASGLAAISAIAQLLSNGDHIVCVEDMYGGTNRYFDKVATKMGITCTLVDGLTSLIIEAIQYNTQLIWIETPTNPLMKIVDIETICSRVHENRPDIIIGLDNTFMSSYFQKPLLLGADLVVHSLTKYMNGHTDVVMGSIATNRIDLYDKLKFLQNAIGCIPSPFDCWLVMRSLKTLHLRMKEHMSNGLAVGRFLESHPAVEKVIHPGLPSHPQHLLHIKQCSGSSGMCSFYIHGGITESKLFVQNVKLFTLAESLGGYESLVEIPALMTHASVSHELRSKLGITDNLIRLSVGLEDIADIIEDLNQALNVTLPKMTVSG